jgi:hypothetical protein
MATQSNEARKIGKPAIFQLLRTSPKTSQTMLTRAKLARALCALQTRQSRRRDCAINSAGPSRPYAALSGAAGVQSARTLDAAVAVDRHMLEASRLLQPQTH